jgi:hypothetical protein
MSTNPNVVPQKRHRDEKLPWFENADFAALYPCCYELLARPEVAGQPRQPATIRLFIDQQRLKAAINDPSSEMVCFVTLDPMAGVWTQLEGYLREGDPDWREQRKPQGARKPF